MPVMFGCCLLVVLRVFFGGRGSHFGGFGCGVWCGVCGGVGFGGLVLIGGVVFWEGLGIWVGGRCVIAVESAYPVCGVIIGA